MQLIKRLIPTISEIKFSYYSSKFNPLKFVQILIYSIYDRNNKIVIDSILINR